MDGLHEVSQSQPPLTKSAAGILLSRQLTLDTAISEREITLIPGHAPITSSGELHPEIFDYLYGDSDTARQVWHTMFCISHLYGANDKEFEWYLEREKELWLLDVEGPYLYRTLGAWWEDYNRLLLKIKRDLGRSYSQLVNKVSTGGLRAFNIDALEHILVISHSPKKERTKRLCRLSRKIEYSLRVAEKAGVVPITVVSDKFESRV